MAKISKEEYHVLKSLGDKWKWITRIEEGAIKTFISKPFKNMDFGRSGSWDIKGNENHAIYTTYSDSFQFIRWEDGEPYSITELIEGYEQKEFYDYIRWEYAESEETEAKKDIERLKEEIETEIHKWDGAEGGWAEDAVDKVFNLIDEFLLSEKDSCCDDKKD